MEEEWRNIEGYEGDYMVSNCGRVKSLERVDRFGRLVKERILKPGKNGNGYLDVNLCKDGKGKTHKVHRLVAEAFLDNPDNKPYINHRDENPLNNHYSNLEWVTPKENINWGTCITRISKTMTNGKRSKPVQGIDPKTGKVVVEFPSTKETERNGYNQGNVAACCRGERKTAYGYIWRYK